MLRLALPFLSVALLLLRQRRGYLQVPLILY